MCDPTDDTGQTSWNVIKTRMLISHFKENEILRNERLKDNDDKAKKNKAMASWHHQNNNQFMLSMHVIPITRLQQKHQVALVAPFTSPPSAA